MENDNLTCIHSRLKEKYFLHLTTTFALNADFTEDMPLLWGEAYGRTFWLYEHGGEFVFSEEIPGQKYRDHWHPMDVPTALDAVADFMEGRRKMCAFRPVYRLRSTTAMSASPSAI